MPNTSNEVITREQLERAMEYVKAYHDSTASGGGGGGGGSVAIQMVAAIPNCYRRAELMTPNKTSITVHANTQVNINGSGYISTEDVELKLSDVLEESERMGIDMYVYACEPTSGTEPVFVVSPNSTVPDGYDADNSRKIGGFHCLCADVGDIDGHELSGYFRGEILPRSVWDLLFRAQSENEGMAYIEGLGVWVDIYLASWDGEKLVSEYGGAFVTGSGTAKEMTGENFAEEFGLIGKRHILRDEFVVVAKGSNETTNITGSANPTTCGGHVDTASRRMISNYGLEDCCGTLWQWTGDTFAIGNTAGMYRSGSNYYGSGCSWAEIASRSAIDGSDNAYGQWYGCLVRFLVGARWDYGSCCGSRSAILRNFSSDVGASIGGRGASGPRTVNAA